MSQASASSPANPTPIRALLDTIERTPPELYGTGRSRFLCRLVHIVLAKFANPDGTGIFASKNLIAALCLASDRGVQKAINHLIKAKLVRKLDTPHEIYGTTQYQLLMPSAEVQEATVTKRKADLKAKNEKLKTRVAEWRAYQKAQHVTEQDGSVTKPDVTEQAGSDTGQDVTEQPDIGNGTMEIGNGTTGHPVTEQAGSVDRPLPSSSLPSCIPSTTTSPSGTATTDAGDAVPVSSSTTPSGKDEFLVRLVKMFEEESYEIRHNKRHYDAVWKEAKEIGPEKYLAAVTLYLDGDYARTDNYLGEEENGRPKIRSWPLHTWLNSLRRKECIDRACRVLNKFPNASKAQFLCFDAFLQRGHILDGEAGLERHLNLLTEDSVARLHEAATMFDPFVSNSWYCLQQTIDEIYEDDDVDAFIQHPTLDKDKFAWVYKNMAERNALTTA